MTSRESVLGAVGAGQTQRVRDLLLSRHAETRAAVGLEPASDLTALQLASLYDADAARAMLERGMVCDLHTACALGRVDTIRRLARSADLGALAEHLTPMGFALVRTRLDAVCALLEAGDDPNRSLPRIGFYTWEIDALAGGGHGGWSPLHAACAHGYAPDAPAIAAALLAAGADSEATSPLGSQPIHLAAVHGWIPVLETLGENGANLDARTAPVSDAVWRLSAPSEAANTERMTPAMLAAREGGVDTLRWFLARGAAANVSDSAGSTPLHYAACPWWGEKPELVSILLAAGADRHARDAAGRTPRDVANMAGFAASAALLAGR